MPKPTLAGQLVVVISSRAYVEVILLSHNSANTGSRVFNSIRHYDLDSA